jgi:hypothetical protein
LWPSLFVGDSVAHVCCRTKMSKTCVARKLPAAPTLYIGPNAVPPPIVAPPHHGNQFGGGKKRKRPNNNTLNPPAGSSRCSKKARCY